jgi:TPR repeat protein
VRAITSFKAWIIALPLAACGTMIGNYNAGMDQYNRHHYVEALDWFKKSAAEGDPNGEFMLGWYSSEGLGGVPKNIAQSCDWYAKAANQGLPRAIYDLGWCYENPSVAYRNINTAVSLYTLAARKGDQMAQTRLAQLGRPVPAADLVPQQQAVQSDSADAAALAVLVGASAIASKSYATPAPTYTPPANNLRCTSQVNGQTIWTNCN